MSTPAPSRKGRLGRRAAAVSTGTLMLCLWGSSTAFAAASPDPVPVTGPLTAAVTAPTPSPVDDLVKQLATTAGIADPLDSGPHHAGGNRPGRHRHHAPGAQRQTPASTGTTHRHHPVRPQATTVTPVSSALPGLRGFGPTVEAISGSVRPPVVITTQASAHQAAPSALSRLLTGDPAEGQTGRILLLALGTMVIGGLAAGHIKLAQDALLAAG